MQPSKFARYRTSNTLNALKRAECLSLFVYAEVHLRRGFKKMSGPILMPEKTRSQGLSWWWSFVNQPLVANLISAVFSVLILGLILALATRIIEEKIASSLASAEARVERMHEVNMLTARGSYLSLALVELRTLSQNPAIATHPDQISALQMKSAAYTKELEKFIRSWSLESRQIHLDLNLDQGDDLLREQWAVVEDSMNQLLSCSLLQADIEDSIEPHCEMVSSKLSHAVEVFFEMSKPEPSIVLELFGAGRRGRSVPFD